MNQPFIMHMARPWNIDGQFFVCCSQIIRQRICENKYNEQAYGCLVEYPKIINASADG